MHRILLFLLTAPLWAQPTYTAISDTLYTPISGVLFSGTLQVSAPIPLVAIGTASIARWAQTYQIRNGAVSFSIAANDAMTQSGTSYVFHFTAVGGAPQWNEYCQVPTSGSPVKLAAICATTPYSPPQGSAAAGRFSGNWPNLLCTTCTYKDAANAFTSGGSLDLSSAASLTLKKGLLSAIPGTCAVGMIYFATDAAAGAQIYTCSATNTWAAQTSGASPSGCTGAIQTNGGGSTLGGDCNLKYDGTRTAIGGVSGTDEGFASPNFDPSVWFFNGTGGTVNTGSAVYVDNGTDHAEDIYQVNTDMPIQMIIGVNYTVSYTVGSVSGSPPTVVVSGTYTSGTDVPMATSVGAHTVSFVYNGGALFDAHIASTAGQAITFTRMSRPTAVGPSLNLTMPIGNAKIDGTPLAAATMAGIDVRAWGVTCDGTTDELAAINSMYASIPNGSTVVYPMGCFMRITDTTILNGKSGITITSPVKAGAQAAGQPRFTWDGPNGGTMMRIVDSDGGTLENLAFSGNSCGAPPGSNSCDSTVRNVAGIGVDLDQTASPVHITSDWRIRGLNISKPGAVNSINFEGIRFSHVSQSNLESMTVKDNYISCTSGVKTNGIAIDVSPSPNTLGYILEGNKNSFCGVGNALGLAASVVKSPRMQSNGIAFTVPNGGGVLEISGCDCERNDQFLVGNGAGGRLKLSNNSIRVGQPPSGQGVVKTGMNITSDSNEFIDGATNVIEFQGTGNNFLSSTNDAYPSGTLALAGWDSFRYSQVRLGQLCAGGGSIQGCSGSIKEIYSLDTGTDLGFESAPTALAGTGGDFYSPHSNKWKKSENGGAVQDVLPTVSATDPGCTVLGARWLDISTAVATFYQCLDPVGQTWTPLASPGSFTRTLPTTVGAEVDIGSFANPAGNMQGVFDVAISDANGTTKLYRFMAIMDGANVWIKVAPSWQASGSTFASYDWDLEVRSNGSFGMDWRIRRTVGTSSWDAKITLLRVGGRSAFTASSGSTYTGAAPMTVLPSTAITSHDNKVDIVNATGFAATVDPTALTAARALLLQNKSGTVALSGDALTVTVVGSLGACNSGAEGTLKVVTDATTPAWNTTLTGGGAVHAGARCNGSAWVAF